MPNNVLRNVAIIRGLGGDLNEVFAILVGLEKVHDKLEINR